MNTNKPIVHFCLLIPCYNNLPGLIKSLKTVRYFPNQFLVVVVDDGSDYPVLIDDIRRAVGEEIPVSVLRTGANQGITRALNTGLDWIADNVDTKYIARLDCGDICDGERFYEQVKFMDEHPAVGLLGSWCMFSDRSGKSSYRYVTPVEHRQIFRAMYFRNVFIHPTVMFRASLLRETGNYPEDFPYAEDYALFWKMINVTQSYVLNRFLVVTEINTEGISVKNRGKQLEARWKVVDTFAPGRYLRLLGFVRLKMLGVVPQKLALMLKKMLR